MAKITLTQAVSLGCDLRQVVADKMGVSVDALTLGDDSIMTIAREMKVAPACGFEHYTTASGKNSGKPAVYLNLNLSRFDCFARQGLVEDSVTVEMVDKIKDRADDLRNKADALCELAATLTDAID